jgi:hypothetical protein
MSVYYTQCTTGDYIARDRNYYLLDKGLELEINYTSIHR